MSRDIRISLNDWEQSDILYGAFLLAYKCCGSDVLGEATRLPYIMDKNTLFVFLKMYGGTTITVPTVEQFIYSVKLMMVYECILNRNYSTQDACKFVGIPYTEDVENKLDVIQTLVENFDEKS